MNDFKQGDLVEWTDYEFPGVVFTGVYAGLNYDDASWARAQCGYGIVGCVRANTLRHAQRKEESSLDKKTVSCNEALNKLMEYRDKIDEAIAVLMDDNESV